MHGGDDIVLPVVISMVAGELAMSGKLVAESFLSIFGRVLKNPMIVSCIAGGLFSVLGIPVPVFAKESLKLLSGAATAIALLSIGGTLDFSSVRQVLRMIRAAGFDCVVRLLVSPVLMWICLAIWPVSRELAQVTVMLYSMPAAVNVFILAKEMHMDAEYAAEVVAATMALGVVSIPVWATVLGIVQG